MVNDTISILFDSFSQKGQQKYLVFSVHILLLCKNLFFYFQTLIKRHINSVWILGLLSQWRKTPWKPRGMHSNAFTGWVSAPPGFTHFDLWHRQSVMSYAICLSYRTKGHFLFQIDKAKNWKISIFAICIVFSTWMMCSFEKSKP